MREEHRAAREQRHGEHDEAESITLPGPWGRCLGVGHQILPGEDGMDGFFYSLLRKRQE